MCVDGNDVSINDGGCAGRVVPPIPPLNMTSIADRTACAKRGGPNFLDTVRVHRSSGKCPSGLVRCSPETSFTDTVCVKEEDREAECPIIDLFVVHETVAYYYRSQGFNLTKDGYP